MSLDEVRGDTPTHVEVNATSTSSPRSIPRLTRKSTGAPYVRPAALEDEIRRALLLPEAEILRRASLRDAQNPDYLSPECLIHLVRRTLRDPAARPVDRLLKLLLERAALDAARMLRGYKSPVLDEILLDTLDSLRDLLLSGRDSVDFFEVKFSHALRTLSIDSARRHKRRVNAVSSIEDIANPPDAQDGESALEDRISHYGLRQNASQEDTVFLRQLLDRLTPRERHAVELVYLLGRKEASSDPNELTAASIMKVSDRMVRTLLLSAKEKARTLSKEAMP